MPKNFLHNSFSSNYRGRDDSLYSDTGQFWFDCIFGILTDEPFSLFPQNWAPLSESCWLCSQEAQVTCVRLFWQSVASTTPS